MTSIKTSENNLTASSSSSSTCIRDTLESTRKSLVHNDVSEKHCETLVYQSQTNSVNVVGPKSRPSSAEYSSSINLRLATDDDDTINNHQQHPYLLECSSNQSGSDSGVGYTDSFLSDNACVTTLITTGSSPVSMRTGNPTRSQQQKEQQKVRSSTNNSRESDENKINNVCTLIGNDSTNSGLSKLVPMQTRSMNNGRLNGEQQVTSKVPSKNNLSHNGANVAYQSDVDANVNVDRLMKDSRAALSLKNLSADNEISNHRIIGNKDIESKQQMHFTSPTRQTIEDHHQQQHRQHQATRQHSEYDLAKESRSSVHRTNQDANMSPVSRKNNATTETRPSYDGRTRQPGEKSDKFINSNEPNDDLVDSSHLKDTDLDIDSNTSIRPSQLVSPSVSIAKPLASPQQSTSLDAQVTPILRSALKKSPASKLNSISATNSSLSTSSPRHVSFNQTVIVFCEEFEASSPSDHCDPPDGYQDNLAYAADDAQSSGVRSGLIGDEEKALLLQGYVRGDLDILSRIVGEDASKLTDEQLIELLENGSLLDGINFNLDDDDDEEFDDGFSILDTKQNYINHIVDSNSDDSESSLGPLETKSQVDTKRQEEASTTQCSNIEDKSSLTSGSNSSSHNQVRNDESIVNRYDHIPSNQSNNLLQQKSLPARLKVSTVDASNSKRNRDLSNRYDESQKKSMTQATMNKDAQRISRMNNVQSNKVESQQHTDETDSACPTLTIRQTNVAPTQLSKTILISNSNQKSVLAQNPVHKMKSDYSIELTNRVLASNSAPATSVTAESTTPVIAYIPDVSHQLEHSAATHGASISSQLVQDANSAKAKAQVIQAQPACHVCRAMESNQDRNLTIISSQQRSTNQQHPIIPSNVATAAQLFQTSYMLRQNDAIDNSLSLEQQQHLHQQQQQQYLMRQQPTLPVSSSSSTAAVQPGDPPLRVTQLLEQPLNTVTASVASTISPSCASCRGESSALQQSALKQLSAARTGVHVGAEPAQAKPLACQIVYVIDQNGNRMKALQVVGGGNSNNQQQIQSNDSLTRQIILTPNGVRFPNPTSTMAQQQATQHLACYVQSAVNRFQVQPAGAINQAMGAVRISNPYQPGPDQTQQQNPIIRHGVNPQQPHNANTTTTAQRQPTVYYVKQPLGAQSIIRQSFDQDDSMKSFPDPHEIRRLDGLRGPSTASIHLAQREKATSSSTESMPSNNKPIPCGSNQAGHMDDTEDPSFGFSRRPAVKVFQSSIMQPARKTNTITGDIIAGDQRNVRVVTIPDNMRERIASARDGRQAMVLLDSQTLDRRINVRYQQQQQQHPVLAQKDVTTIPGTSSMSDINRSAMMMNHMMMARSQNATSLAPQSHQQTNPSTRQQLQEQPSLRVVQTSTSSSSGKVQVGAIRNWLNKKIGGFHQKIS